MSKEYNIINSNCPHCKKGCKLTTDQIKLINRIGQQNPTTYAFNCTYCKEFICKPISEFEAGKMHARGVAIIHERNLNRFFDHPPLTLDDLIDLHNELEKEDWFEKLSSMVVPS